MKSNKLSKEDLKGKVFCKGVGPCQYCSDAIESENDSY